MRNQPIQLIFALLRYIYVHVLPIHIEFSLFTQRKLQTQPPVLGLQLTRSRYTVYPHIYLDLYFI